MRFPPAVLTLGALGAAALAIFGLAAFPAPFCSTFFSFLASFACFFSFAARTACSLPGIPFQSMVPLAFSAEKDLRLSVGSAHPLPVAGVDLQARKRANLNFQHFLSFNIFFIVILNKLKL